MLERLKKRVPDAKDDALLNELLKAAGDAVCAYTGRAKVPAPLESAQICLAAIGYNRMGMEGEISRSEGSVSRSVEALPEDIRRQLNPWRLARAVNSCD